MGRLMQRAVPLKNSPTVANPTLAALLHELNQPLTAILSNAQAAQRCLSDSPAPGSSGLAHGSSGLLEHRAELQEILADIVADDKKAAAIIQRLIQAIKDAEDE
jgi:signal transduction histidine kinase